MILFKKADAMARYIKTQKEEGKTIGFVPTMGALHDGHSSLLRRAKMESGLTVCSIFVNPTQFNNPDDFKKYPITLEKDIERLISLQCDVLFLPAVEEIYPASYQAKHYQLGSLETLLEGKYRPGHFQGVCQVLDRLFDIVSPSAVYMGQKDYQQCQVVQRLLQLTGRNEIELCITPTVREADGLAMSSRNLRLNEAQRRKAPALFEQLVQSKALFGRQPLQQITSEATRHLTSKGFSVDYFEIADAQTLESSAGTAQPSVALVAAFLDDIRLIDNLPLN